MPKDHDPIFPARQQRGLLLGDFEAGGISAKVAWDGDQGTDPSVLRREVAGAAGGPGTQAGTIDSQGSVHRWQFESGGHECKESRAYWFKW